MDLRDLQRGPVETTARVEPNDPLFEGLDIEPIEAFTVEGRLQATGEGEYFWRGHVRGAVRTACRRCLADVRYDVDAPIDVLFSSEPEAAEDPDVIPLPPTAAQIDLAPVVREEVALSVPAFLLCREECAGLCPKCGADLNQGPCGCTPAEPS